MNAKTSIRKLENGFELLVETKKWKTVVNLTKDETTDIVRQFFDFYQLLEDRVFEAGATLFAKHVATVTRDADARVAAAEAQRDEWKAACLDHRTALEKCFVTLTSVANGFSDAPVGQTIGEVGKVLNQRRL